MRKHCKILLGIMVLLFAGENATSQQVIISSPDKRIAVSVFIEKDRKVYYTVSAGGKEVVQPSRLGLVREDEDFSAGLKWINTSAAGLTSDDYSILTAKKSRISYRAARRTVYLQSAGGKKINIIFQVSNDGVAFRYYFPESSPALYKIKEEVTSFHFSESTRTWLQPKAEAQSGWEHCNPAYEESYLMDEPAGKPSPSSNGYVFPALFHSNDQWILITEAGLEPNYCGTSLRQFAPSGEYSIGFPQPAEGMKGKPVNPESTLPWYTPWRVIAIGDLAAIAQSTLGTDLASPAVTMDMSFIKPGKASWSWAINHDEAVNYGEQIKFIDYAADMHWQYCLVDADWDTRIGYDSIQLLCNYAASKKIGLLLWYNSAGDWNTTPYHPKNALLTHESRVKEFTRIKKMGIKGVKIDFFAGDGQSMIAYYYAILKDAAAIGLLVNFHGATLPRGLERTYPNLMTAEAVKGFEMITFFQQVADAEPAHCAILPFTRNAFDPMDFTPMCLYKIPNIIRKTTGAFELALSVLFISGIQHYAERPEGMATVPSVVKNFLQQVPSSWDDVKFIEGFPGKYIVVARRSGKNWWVAGINGEGTTKKLSLDLSFAGKHWKGTLITDDKSGPGFTEEQIVQHNKMPVEITMQANGGFVMVLNPK
jgi:Glycoside hydrolase 97/Glycosyl-hydrolase 97 N-terminal/Glycosyl-hydrolase 97 C-terminal, oligomerisation